MKYLINYIRENFLIDKDYKEELRDLSKVNFTEVRNQIEHMFSPTELVRNRLKVKYYKDKNSNPQRLANSIKDKSKLLIRWYLAICEDWIECAKVFRQEIVKRGYFTEDELDAYILRQYVFFNGNDKPLFKKYLNTFGIEHR